ncbi:MAG TPA: hypothetical protein VK540_30525 [Polyangiaceae bacterium]|nr:hypothetical protein [Polyangiaceae bacterium]
MVAALAVSCGHGASPGPGPLTASRDDGAATIAVEKKDAYPNMVRIVRDGDPRPAVAMVVETSSGSYASTALAALLEARLARAGFAGTDSRADRDSFRVRTLVESPTRAVEFVAAARAALAGRVTAGSPEFALVVRRVAALRRHPLEAPIAQAVARCTGELGVLPSDASIDPSTSEGVAQLEATRGAAYGASQVAFAAVGAQALVDAAAGAVHRGEAWPRGTAPEGALLAEDQVGVHASSERAPGTARLTLAVPTPSADTAAAASRRAGDPEGPLVTRLRSLTVPFRLVEARASARPRGGCLSVTLETARATPAHLVADGAALATTLVRQELDLARSSSNEPGMERGAAGWPLGPAGRAAVRLASDPREAAELGALWSLSTPGSADDKPSYAIALALPSPTADAREATLETGVIAQAARRFSAALERAAAAWNAPAIERMGRLERGQGELWLVLASPCGALAEGSSDPGTTALALMAALAAQPGSARGVTLEPWVAPDGVGVVAHAARAPGESMSGLTARVAEEAAQVLVAAPFSSAALATARAVLLNRMGDGIAAEGRAMSALAAALVPGHPSWLAPFGAWEELANASVDAASVRWSTLAGGPLRLAVLANESEEQTDLAARTVDRWLVRGIDGARACAAVEPPGAAKSGTVQVTLPSSAPPVWQALLGFPVPPSGTAEGAMGELTLAGLSGPDGWLGRATAAVSLAATAQARLVGGARAAALVIDIRAPEATLDAAVAQVRALLQRLRQGAIAPTDLERSQALRERWDLEASLDPRRRLLSLWREPRLGAASSPAVAPAAVAPSLEGWRAWAANTLSDEKLVVVIARPKR